MSAAGGRARPARFAAVVALLGVLGPGVLAAGPGLAQVKPPPDFKLPKADGSPGEVTFGHARHLTKVDKCAAGRQVLRRLPRRQDAAGRRGRVLRRRGRQVPQVTAGRAADAA